MTTMQLLSLHLLYGFHLDVFMDVINRRLLPRALFSRSFRSVGHLPRDLNEQSLPESRCRS